MPFSLAISNDIGVSLLQDHVLQKVFDRDRLEEGWIFRNLEEIKKKTKIFVFQFQLRMRKIYPTSYIFI